VLWIERFDTFEALRAAVRAFTITYNHTSIGGGPGASPDPRHERHTVKTRLLR
jgi:hypothetical protein